MKPLFLDTGQQAALAIPEGKETDVVRPEGICLEAHSRPQSREGDPQSGCVEETESGGSEELMQLEVTRQSSGGEGGGWKNGSKQLCLGVPLSLY